MDAGHWLSFLGAAFLIAVLPGPGVANVVGYAVGSGRRTAFAAVGGAVLGSLIALVLSLTGAAGLLLASPYVFVALEITGGIYLVFVGVLAVVDAGGRRPANSPDRSSATPAAAFSASVAVSAFNPKSIAFFLSFVPPFIDLRESVVLQVAILSGTFATIVAFMDTAYVLLALRIASRLREPRVVALVRWTNGGILIAIGIAITVWR